MVAPSGDHTGGPSTPSMWKASPPGPRTRTNQTGLGSSPREDEKDSSEPSGDQRGPLDSSLGLVTANGSPAGRPPASGWTQISRWRRFSSSTTVVTVNATCAPSGETATSPTTARR